MERSSDEGAVMSQRRDQILKLITRGFFNELINYGVRREEIVRVASHLLDNVLDQQGQPSGAWPVYNTLFDLDSVRDEWKTERRLTIGEVTLRPLEPELIPEVARWLRIPEVSEGFVPAFPPTVEGLQAYFARPE